MYITRTCKHVYRPAAFSTVPRKRSPEGSKFVIDLFCLPCARNTPLTHWGLVFWKLSICSSKRFATICVIWRKVCNLCNLFRQIIASKVTIRQLTESVKCELQSVVQRCLFDQTSFPETEVCLLNYNGRTTSWPSVAC